VENVKALNGTNNGSPKGAIEVCTEDLPGGNFELDLDIIVDIPIDQCDSTCNAYQELY